MDDDMNTDSDTPRDSRDDTPAFALPIQRDADADRVTSADADALASGVDPDDVGVADDAVPEDAERDPEATP